MSPERRAEIGRRFNHDEQGTWHRTSSPEVDQVQQVYDTPHGYALPPLTGIDLSGELPEPHPIRRTPWERRPKVVQDLVSDLVHGGTDRRMLLDDPKLYAECFYIDFLRSSLLDRRPLPLKQKGEPNYGYDGTYTNGELREEFIYRSGLHQELRREALFRAEEQFLTHNLPAACEGSGLVVITHGVGSEFGDARPGELLPDGTRFTQTKLAFPVPVGYTADRVARIVSSEAFGCKWCDATAVAENDERPAKPWRTMLVSTGGALHCITTCDRCVESIGPGPDYYRFDNADGLRGWPAERYR